MDEQILKIIGQELDRKLSELSELKRLVAYVIDASEREQRDDGFVSRIDPNWEDHLPRRNRGVQRRRKRDY